jgi:type I restriction enzyme S subunit
VNWPIVQLKDIGNIVTGSTPSKSVPEYFGGNIPFIAPGELGKSIYVDTAKQSLSEEGGKVSRLLPKNAVMVCCIGSLGKTAITTTQVATNQQINSIIVDESIADPLFVYFYCLTLKPLLESMAPATTVAIINKTRFSELEIPLPPLSVQKQIAAALEKADTCVGNANKWNKN